MSDTAYWHTKSDGYNREMWLIERGSERVIGEVEGSHNNGEWHAYRLTADGATTNLGQYLSEAAAKRAVEASQPAPNDSRPSLAEGSQL